MSDTKGLTKLGSQGTKYEMDNPSIKTLEVFNTKHLNPHLVQWNCPEFTSLCPKTGQPDFATIKIRYIPRSKCIESKSLKLYLFSFRNHGEFHEDCCNRIAKDIQKKIDPYYVEVIGEFMPRGGISIWPRIVLWDENITNTEFKERIRKDLL